jgi:hypothetical protein
MNETLREIPLEDIIYESDVSVNYSPDKVPIKKICKQK